MKTFSVLYNDSYGGDFGFSAEFEAEYRRRTGRPTHTTERLLRLVGSESIRMDPVAIELVREKGSVWSSGPGAALVIHELPAIFERYWEVENAYGCESIHVNVSEALADVLHDYMSTGDHGALVDRYRSIQAAARGLKETRFAGTHVCDGYGSYTGV